MSLPHHLTAAAFVKHGLTLHMKCPVTGTLTATATAAQKKTHKQHLAQSTVGTGKARVSHAGAVALVLRATKRDSEQLRRVHGIPLTISLHIKSLHTTVHFVLR